MPRQAEHYTVTERLKLDVLVLHKAGNLSQDGEGVISWGCGSTMSFKLAGERITLDYFTTRQGEKTKHQCSIYLSRVACCFGGSRPWFICPRCHKRVGAVYFNTAPACRKCSHLRYDSQREQPADRARRRARKTRHKLDWPMNFTLRGDKPKGMHWATYRRMVNKQDSDISQSLGAMLAFIEKMSKSIDKVTAKLPNKLPAK